jgi:hypothetical protein
MSVRIVTNNEDCRPFFGEFARVVGEVLPAARTATTVLAKNRDCKHVILLIDGLVEGGICYLMRAEAGVEYAELKVMAVRPMNRGYGTQLYDALLLHCAGLCADSHKTACQLSFLVCAQGLSCSFFLNQGFENIKKSALPKKLANKLSVTAGAPLMRKVLSVSAEDILNQRILRSIDWHLMESSNPGGGGIETPIICLQNAARRWLARRRAAARAAEKARKRDVRSFRRACAVRIQALARMRAARRLWLIVYAEQQQTQAERAVADEQRAASKGRKDAEIRRAEEAREVRVKAVRVERKRSCCRLSKFTALWFAMLAGIIALFYAAG